MDNKDTPISTLDFDLRKYYLPMSTGPRVVEKPKTMWRSGSPELIAYMNTVYLPGRMSANENEQNTLIYQRKGSVGIATQLFSTCDTLLFGILQNRSVQSRYLTRLYRLVNTPSIPSHFFSFPIFNFTFPATLRSGSGSCILFPSPRVVPVQSRDRRVEQLRSPRRSFHHFHDFRPNERHVLFGRISVNHGPQHLHVLPAFRFHSNQFPHLRGPSE